MNCSFAVNPDSAGTCPRAPALDLPINFPSSHYQQLLYLLYLSQNLCGADRVLKRFTEASRPLHLSSMSDSSGPATRTTLKLIRIYLLAGPAPQSQRILTSAHNWHCPFEFQRQFSNFSRAPWRASWVCTPALGESSKASSLILG